MLLREISELSLEPAIEGRFDASIFVFPSGVAKKYVDAFSERQILKKNQRRYLLNHRRGLSGPRTVRSQGRIVCSLNLGLNTSHFGSSLSSHVFCLAGIADLLETLPYQLGS
jgi:hypothetical protein